MNAPLARVLALACALGSTGLAQETDDLGTAVAAPAEAHWGQWRGPLGTGVAPGSNPPTRWSA